MVLMPLEEIDLVHLKRAKKLLLDLEKKAKNTKIKESKISFGGKPLLEEFFLPALNELKKKS